MSHVLSSRTIVITLILIALAAVTVTANWGNGFGFSLFAANEAAGGAGPPATNTLPPPLNAVTSFDLGMVVRHVNGTPALTTNEQLVAADATGNCAVSSIDGAAIAQYVLGIGGGGTIGTTLLPPGPCGGLPIAVSVVRGDVSAAPPATMSGSGVATVSLPDVTATPGTIVVPITVNDLTGLGVLSYDIQVNFNSAIITPTGSGVSNTGTLSSSMTVSSNTANAGHLIISGVSGSTTPLSGSGTLLNLQFNVIGTTGQSTALIFADYNDPGNRDHQSFLFNEGLPDLVMMNGSVTIGTPTPTNTATPTPTPSNIVSVWTGTTGNWNNPADWSSNPNYPNNGQPNAVDLYDAVLNNGGTINRNTPITIQNFSLSPFCVVTGPDSLTINQGFNWSGGILTGAGSINIPNGGVVNISGDNSATLDTLLNNAGTINLVNGSNSLDFSKNASIHNNGGSVFDLQSSGTTFQNIGGGSFHNNMGATLRKSSGGISDFGVPVMNNGIVDAQAGTLTFNFGFTQTGGVLSLNGGSVSSFSPVGFELQGGQVVGNGTIDGSPTQSGGTIAPGFSIGTIVVTGSHTFVGTSTYLCEIDSSSVLRNNLVAVGSSDKIIANGIVIGSGSISTPDIGRPGNRPDAILPPGTIFLLIDNTSTSPISGEFDGRPEGSLITVSGNTFRVSYVGGSGNDMTLTSVGVSGVIIYGNAVGPGPAPPRFVRNVSVASTAGSPAVGPVITGTPGTYALSGFGAGSYTIKPTKPGGANVAISSADAARVAQGVSGSVPFVSDNQRFAADTSGNGAVSSTDASKIAQFVTGLPFSPPNLTGQWRFFISNLPAFPAGAHPQERTYASVTSNVTGEDYIGLLIGETSGNYNPASHARPVGSRQLAGGSRQLAGSSGPVRGIEVKLPQMAVSTEKEIVIPVSVEGAADKKIFSYEFDLRYDPSVIQPLENLVDVAGTVSRGLSVVANPYEPGLLRVVVYGAMPIDENGLLLNLRFTSVGKPGSISPLTWERIMFNEGESRVMASDGQIEISY